MTKDTQTLIDEFLKAGGEVRKFPEKYVKKEDIKIPSQRKAEILDDLKKRAEEK